ncbi:unnamed protein product [Darwinula stevensoni]|nr:unnamed protein product [Darwinula stevensoni]CAG0881585.1 unnamed protein product [Darwinula stevensoni]
MGFHPLRKKEIVGNVTAISRNYGVVNNEVYFLAGVCSEEYAPRKGDDVRVMAIESDQGKYGWRAINVLPIVLSQIARPFILTKKSTDQGMFLSPHVSQLLENKAGIIIVPNTIDFGTVMMGEKKTMNVMIENHSSVDHSLGAIQIQGNPDKLQFQVLSQSGYGEVLIVIPPQGFITVMFQCIGTSYGHVHDLCIFTVSQFRIGRYLTVRVVDPLQEDLITQAPYHNSGGIRDGRKRRQPAMHHRMFPQNHQSVVPGQKIFQPSAFLPFRLPQFAIPKTLMDLVLKKGNILEYESALGEELSPRNYISRFRILLFLEEIGACIHMKQFDMHNVSLKPIGSFLQLDVPGLAEKRPSLIIGDSVILSDPCQLLNVLTDRRVFAPYGMEGGQKGTRGLNLLMRRNRTIINLGSKTTVEVVAGDVFRLETPGGGGWGREEEMEDEGCPDEEEDLDAPARTHKLFAPRGSIQGVVPMQQDAA